MDIYDLDNDGVKDIIVGTTGGNLIAYDGKTYTQKWTAKVATTSIDAIKVETIYSFFGPVILVCTGGTLKVFDLNNRTELWTSKSLGNKSGYLNNIVTGDFDLDGKIEVFLSGDYIFYRFRS